jgi:hypothetical protein
MHKETAAERRAREAEEVKAREAKWEAEKPMRLLMALARANELNIDAVMCYAGADDHVLYYSFIFGGWNSYSDPYVKLGEGTMECIENELANIAAKRAKERRLRQVKEELLARLTDEEREALGL